MKWRLLSSEELSSSEEGKDKDGKSAKSSPENIVECSRDNNRNVAGGLMARRPTVGTSACSLSCHTSHNGSLIRYKKLH